MSLPKKRIVIFSGCPAAVEVRHGRNYAEIAAQGELFSFGKEGVFRCPDFKKKEIE